jgi:hypothetical protein
VFHKNLLCETEQGNGPRCSVLKFGNEIGHSPDAKDIGLQDTKSACAD